MPKRHSRPAPGRISNSVRETESPYQRAANRASWILWLPFRHSQVPGRIVLDSLNPFSTFSTRHPETFSLAVGAFSGVSGRFLVIRGRFLVIRRSSGGRSTGATVATGRTACTVACSTTATGTSTARVRGTGTGTAASTTSAVIVSVVLRTPSPSTRNQMKEGVDPKA